MSIHARHLLWASLALSLLSPGNWSLGAQDAPAAPQPSWQLGPFVRLADQPIIAPNAASSFVCPMRGREVHWEAQDTFNPAAVVYEGKVCVLYRAEDDSAKGLGARTSRLGLATSEDGIHFQRRAAPVFFPKEDLAKPYEWMGGCEDPRVVEGPDGTFFLYYTMWNRGHPDKHSRRAPRLGVASSKNLVDWTKHGGAFEHSDKIFNSPHKSASVVTSLQDGKLKAVKIQGKYWMYWGEPAVFAATSEDLITWLPVLDEKGNARILMAPHQGRFDSQLTECGPPALLTDRGIILIYNGKNGGDAPTLGKGAYAAGQVLFDAADPLKVLERGESCFFKPELSFEKSGQYPAGTVFAEGLVYFKNQWLMYYGTADSFVGVAASPAQ